MAVTLPAVDDTVYFQIGGMQFEATVTGVVATSEDGMITLRLADGSVYRSVIYSEQPRDGRWGIAGDGGVELVSMPWGGCPTI